MENAQMEVTDDQPPLQLIFIGRSLQEIKSFPSDVRQDAGFNLDLVQNGQTPTDWKSLKSVGDGVREIRLWDDSGTYRVVYIVKKADAVYVLGAFKKTSQKTEERHLKLLRERYKEVG
jgi:phage-related protein